MSDSQIETREKLEKLNTDTEILFERVTHLAKVLRVELATLGGRIDKLESRVGKSVVINT